MTSQNMNQPQDPRSQPQYVYVSTTAQDTMRAIAATRSYIGPAILTLALYWLLFWVGGVIANVLYLYSANNAERISGVSPEGKGCLWILLIVHVILPIALVFILIVMGGLTAILAAIGGALGN